MASRLRRPFIVLAISFLIAATIGWIFPSPTAAAPAGCRNGSAGYVEFCDQSLTAPGWRGSIGLLGDSVLLGSANGVSTPGLPTLLANAGWGPVRLTTSVGMATYLSNAAYIERSAYHMVSRWKSQGFTPQVIAINLGANQLGTCTVSNLTACVNKIEQLLTHIANNYPSANVWWAKVVQKSSGNYTNSMLAWNAALDAVAGQRPNLLIWDWPMALATANPTIATSPDGVHPNSATQYARRSALIADHLNSFMSAARQVGAEVSPPSPYDDDNPARLTMINPGPLYDTSLGAPLPAASTTTIPWGAWSGTVANARGVLVSMAVTSPSANGYVTLYSCSAGRPAVATMTYTAANRRALQSMTRRALGDQLCLYTSAATHVRLEIHGLLNDGGNGFAPRGDPLRLLNTRLTGRAASHVVSLPTNASAAAFNITVAGSSAAGTVLVDDNCVDDNGVAMQVPFAAGETIGSAIITRTASPEPRTICVRVQTPGSASLADVFIDLVGEFTDDPAAASWIGVPPTRLLDTRSSAVGGWLGRHGIAQTLPITTAGPGVVAMTGTLTLIRPTMNGHLRASPCGSAVPPTAAVNSAAGATISNSLTMGVGSTTQQVCLYASSLSSTVLDVTGWWIMPIEP